MGSPNFGLAERDSLHIIKFDSYALQGTQNGGLNVTNHPYRLML